jgi:predicted PurR-regulated permease PerM
VLTGIGMSLFGVPNAALFGVLAGIASLIPSIGTALVAVPAIIFLLATGHPANAIGFAIWSGALVGMVDNFLNPYIVGTKLQVPPLLILFSVLGGISLMGPVGILIGPLTMSLLYVLMSLYRHGLGKE